MTQTIIGYVGTLSHENVPCVVTPIILGEDGIDEAELAPLVERDLATKIEPISVEPDYALWVDATLHPRYAPTRKVHRILTDCTERSISEALNALYGGRLHPASQLAQIAINASPNSLIAVLLKAVAQEMLGHREQVRTLLYVAENIVEEATT